MSLESGWRARLVLRIATVVWVVTCHVAAMGVCAGEITGMTYAQAKQRIPSSKPPSFWIGDVTSLADRFARLKRCEVKVIAESPGGRRMHLVTFGVKEASDQKANFNSAVGAREPAAYRSKAKRARPVILFVGPLHGHEVEALTGLVNLIEVLETGRDLRDRTQPRLVELAAKCRLLIIPEGNPDGIARFEPRALNGMAKPDVRFWGQGTWSDGTFCGWPGAKRQHPMIGANVGFLGCYFNDRGINPMHDEFFDPMGPEAPAILRVAADEAPDAAVSFHSHESAPAVLRPAYVPIETQQEVRELAVRYYELLADRSLPHAAPFEPTAEKGPHPPAFNLTGALYHVSGARSFTFECPHGIRGGCAVTFDQILDIQLTLYQAMMRYELERKQR